MEGGGSDGGGELDWLLDCMASYLKSPMWQHDICTFIDDNCWMFVGECGDENSLESTEVHNLFKKLIDRKLDEFCSEFGVNHMQFLQACQSMSATIHRRCVEQILSVDNFLLFKRMMISRNTMLNQSALSELADAGYAVPERYTIQSLFDAEEAQIA